MDQLFSQRDASAALLVNEAANDDAMQRRMHSMEGTLLALW